MFIIISIRNTTIILLLIYFPNLYGESDNENAELIIKAAQLFSTHSDLVQEGHEIFINKVNKKTDKTFFVSKQWHNKIFQTLLGGPNKNSIFIIDKSSDGLHPSENTHIILIQSLLNNTQYTAHKAYIRSIDGEKSVEWDFYEIHPQLVYKSFFTAVTPTEYFESDMFEKDSSNNDFRPRKMNGFFTHAQKENERNYYYYDDDDESSNEEEHDNDNYYSFQDVSDENDKIGLNVKSDYDQVHETYELPKSAPLKNQILDTERIKELKEETPSENKADSNSSIVLESESSYNLTNDTDSNETVANSEIIATSQFKQSGRSMQRKLPLKNVSVENDEKPISETLIEKVITEEDEQISTTTEKGSDGKYDAVASNERNQIQHNGKFKHVDYKPKSPAKLKPDPTSSAESKEKSKPVINNKTKQRHQSGRSMIRSKTQNNYTSSNLDGNNHLDIPEINFSNIFMCPFGSGAILEGNRCQCPQGTVLQNKKCLNKISPSIEQASNLTMFKDIQKQLDFDNATIDQIDNINITVKKRQSENFSFDADMIQHPRLGPFYAELLKVHFNKDKATSLMKNASKKFLIFFKERYQIGYNKNTGHPQFESKKLPFTGIMDCEYKERKLKSFHGTIEQNIVDYFLYALRAQCHQNLRKNTLKLFKQKVVFLHKNLYNHIVELNTKSDLLTNHPILNKKEWQDFISAIYLSKFSEAFSEQKIKLDKKIDDSSLSPDGKHVTLTVRTLTIMVEKIMHLLKQKQFQCHAVKITKSLIMTVTEYIQNIHKQEFIVNLFCKGCKMEHVVFHQAMKQLTLLSHYIMFGFQDILTNSLTFDEFYNDMILKIQIHEIIKRN